MIAGQNKFAMLQDLSTVKTILETSYAPKDWKKNHDGWDLEGEYQKAVAAITEERDLSLKEFQQVLLKFIQSAMDYHVDISFNSTESANLPFRVKTIDQRTYVDWIDPIKLSKEISSLREGDEILEFDDQPIAEVMAMLSKKNYMNNENSTDMALRDIKLTNQRGSRGDVVSTGFINIVFRSFGDGKIRTIQLIWDYFPELVKVPSSLMQTIPYLNLAKQNHSEFSDYANRLFASYANDEDEGAPGSPVSFVPQLGKEIWRWKGNFEGEQPIESKSNYPMWNAYIYENDEGRLIGYIRIPGYQGSDAEALNFGMIIGYMENNTEALVIDQVNNFGGSANFLYSLASMLTMEPLKAPRERVKLTLSLVHKAIGRLKMIDEDLNRPDLKEVLKFWELKDRQQLLIYKHYSQFIVDEWNAGQDLTGPIHMFRCADIINPNPSYNYTKPILFLINELDISCGDIMPAILQDNQRAVLFGCKTAGAGGHVLHTSFPNKHGIAEISYTGSILQRVSQEIIESVGVSPDIEYVITAEDVQNRYVNYALKINEVVSSMLPNQPVEDTVIVN